MKRKRKKIGDDEKDSIANEYEGKSNIYYHYFISCLHGWDHNRFYWLRKEKNSDIMKWDTIMIMIKYRMGEEMFKEYWRKKERKKEARRGEEEGEG